MNNLTLSLPCAEKRSDLTLHFSLRGYILSYLEALKEENLWEQRDYSGFVPHSCILESTSLCPWRNHWCSFPSLPLFCEIFLIWRIEVVETQVEDLFSQFRRGDDIGCHLYLCLHLIENIHFLCITCVIMNICIQWCIFFNYMLDLNIIE